MKQSKSDKEQELVMYGRAYIHSDDLLTSCWL